MQRRAAKGKLRRTQDERRRATQSAILRASLKLLVQHGYAQFSASRVASIAGVSRGAREHHFRTREALLIATLRHAMDEAVAHARLLAEDAGNAPDPIATFLADSEHFFFSPRYRAFMEIMVAVKSQPKLLRLWRPVLRSARTQLDTIWANRLKAAGYEAAAARNFISLTHYLLRGLMLAETWLPYRVDRRKVMQSWRVLAPLALRRSER